MYLSSFFFGAHLPSDLYWLGKIQPTYSQTLPAAAQCCQSFILYFPLRLASSFSWRARRHIRRKRRRRRSGSIGLLKERDERGKQRKKVVSSPQEKIWKYFCINKYLLTLKKENQKGKRERRPSSHVYSNCICMAIKHIQVAILLPLSTQKSFSVSTLHRPIDWCRYWDWRSWEMSTIKFHNTEMYRDWRIIPGVPVQSVLLHVPPCFPFTLIEAIFFKVLYHLNFLSETPGILGFMHYSRTQYPQVPCTSFIEYI